MYLDDAGAHVYLFTTDLALEWGLIGSGEYLTRLQSLRSMVDPALDIHHLVSERLDPFEGESPQGWPDDGESASLVVAPVLEVHSEPGDPQAAQPDREKPVVLHLITDRAGVLGDKWVFHQYDDDFFPSVPHGHLKPKPRVKLDAYRGYTYDTGRGNQPLAREHRDFIIALWKNGKFCVFARKALDYFVARHPTFDWWAYRRIPHPLRLPRY